MPKPCHSILAHPHTLTHSHPARHTSTVSAYHTHGHIHIHIHLLIQPHTSITLGNPSPYIHPHTPPTYNQSVNQSSSQYISHTLPTTRTPPPDKDRHRQDRHRHRQSTLDQVGSRSVKFTLTRKSPPPPVHAFSVFLIQPSSTHSTNPTNQTHNL